MVGHVLFIGATTGDLRCYACPYTAGYWNFLARHEREFAGNHRMAQPLRGLRRLTDLDTLVEQERARGSRAP
jgi:deoxyribodipyrimidine photolyase-related protein